MTFSRDTLLYVLDRDPELVYSELRSRACEPSAIAVCLGYGRFLPAGREWGSRIQRHQWLESERAKTVRKHVARLALSSLKTNKDLMKLYRAVRKERSRGPVLKWLVKEWHSRNDVDAMDLT